jgi:hypothetical protein
VFGCGIQKGSTKIDSFNKVYQTLNICIYEKIYTTICENYLVIIFAIYLGATNCFALASSTNTFIITIRALWAGLLVLCCR